MAKLLYFISEDWFFCSHFFDRALAAQKAGHEVTLLTRVSNHGAILQATGFKVVELSLDRSSTNLWRELMVVAKLVRLYRRERPELVHHVALKPIVYGSFAARLLGIRAIVNAPVGMGHAFTLGGTKGRVLQGVIGVLLRWMLNPPGSKVVFENEEDLNDCVRMRSVRVDDAILIPGAGVDMDVFHADSRRIGPPAVVMGSRMLREKGVAEFVQAAQMLKSRGVEARFVLAGDPDPANPSAVPRAELQAWHDSGAVEWIGHCKNMAGLLRQSHVACLPSYYREGLPKFLLEAMACGLPVVTTDARGCRQAVEHAVTGLLVPPRDPAALAVALEALIGDASARERMGQAGRERALRLFDGRIIVCQTLAVYERLLRSVAGAAAPR